ncbi:MAG: hypothetical protein J1E16_05645 [Muribaculaceae bacterium]|nr:hypothetical protein [Muribaculaceae bacterium]
MNIDLNKYIPNKLPSAPGELTLGDKLSPFMESAKEWFEKWFCNLSLIAPPEENEDGDLEDAEGALPEDDLLRKVPVNEMAMRIIVMEAYRMAVPQLDLVLTANGFATVDSKNVVPASKARTDRLLEGLQEEIDRNIIVLLYRLRTIPEWLESEQADFFRRTLFINPEATKYLKTPDALGIKSSWEIYLKLIPQIEELEDSLADEWFSPELMMNLRKEMLSGEIEGVRKSVAIKIQNQVIAFFEKGDFKTRRLQEILNIIRYDNKNFPEWINSETALAFYPPKFKNKKDSPGYFF